MERDGPKSAVSTHGSQMPPYRHVVTLCQKPYAWRQATLDRAAFPHRPAGKPCANTAGASAACRSTGFSPTVERLRWCGARHWMPGCCDPARPLSRPWQLPRLEKKVLKRGRPSRRLGVIDSRFTPNTHRRCRLLGYSRRLDMSRSVEHALGAVAGRSACVGTVAIDLHIIEARIWRRMRCAPVNVLDIS